MAKINFNLRSPKSDSLTPINMIIRYNNQTLVFPTEISIHPDNWNVNEQRVKQTKKAPQFPELNQRLTDLSNVAIKVYNRYRNDHSNDHPSLNALRDQLNIALGRTTAKVRYDFFSFVEAYLEDLPKKQNLQTNKPLAKITIRAYKQSFNYLQAFSKSARKRIDFDDIDIDFYSEFLNFLTHDKGLKINTIGKHLRNLKTFLTEAANRGLHHNFSFKQKAFKVVNEKSDSIYLNEIEIDKLKNLDLSGHKRLQNVRDLFIVACRTGFRFSDFTQIQPFQLKSENDFEYFEVEMQKTGHIVTIPFHSDVKKIMEKYNGQTTNSLPRPLSNQKMNDYLKELGKMLPELNVPFTKTFLSKGQKVNRQTPKWELLSTHTGRRSFATNLYLKGVPSQTIMQLTGHKTEKSFLKYLKINDKDAAKKISSLWQKDTSLRIA